MKKMGIHRSGIAYKSRRWCVFKAAMAWGALGAAVIASTMYYLAPEYGFLMIVPLEFTGVYTAAFFADLALRRQEEKRLLSRSVMDQRELLKVELEENLAILRGVTGLSSEQLAEEQLRIIREFRLRRSRLLTRQIAQHRLRRVIEETAQDHASGEGAAPDEQLSYRTNLPRRGPFSPATKADTLSRRDPRRPSRGAAREGRTE